VKRLSYRAMVWLSLGLFLLVGAWLVRHSQATLVTHWMLVYEVQDFATPSAMWAYAQHLRMTIPIVLSLLEIASFQATGSTWLVDTVLYRSVLVLAFTSAIAYGAWRRRGATPDRGALIRLGLTWLLGGIFLWSTVLIHPGNPLPYDLLYPLLILGYLLLLRAAQRMDPATGRGWRFGLACGSAGVLLALADLSRPFVFYLLPIILWFTVRALRGRPRHGLLVFLLTFFLSVGPWHIYQFLAHDQLSWGNHSGFNLIRVWLEVPQPALVPEIHAAPLVPGRWANIDTAEHAENSRRLQTAVMHYILTHPLQSVARVVWRIGALMRVKTAIWRHVPHGPILLVYRPAVWGVFGLFVVTLLRQCLKILQQGRRAWTGRVSTDAILLFVTGGSLLMLAIGDAGEEARFLISILPLLLACPLEVPWRGWRNREPHDSAGTS
jgi:hypothetical protein